MAYRLVFGYAFVRRQSEQNSSLQLLQGAAVKVLRFSSLGCSLDQFLCTRPCYVIGGDSDTSASIKRCENRIGPFVTRRAELPTGRFEANVRMTRSQFARRRGGCGEEYKALGAGEKSLELF